jgi:hypothetical protein
LTGRESLCFNAREKSSLSKRFDEAHAWRSVTQTQAHPTLVVTGGELEQLTELCRRLGAEPAQADAMARQLMKRADQT